LQWKATLPNPTPWKLKHSKTIATISAFFAFFAVQISTMGSTPAPGVADCAPRSAFEHVKNSIAASVHFALDVRREARRTAAGAAALPINICNGKRHW
jgi:hypothetical protein